MNLAQIVQKLGDKHYPIGRPIYHGSDDEEYQPVLVHAHPVRESGAKAILERIRRERQPEQLPGIVLAYGGFYGVDMAAEHGASGVLLLDVNPEQKTFWRAAIALMAECPTAAEFNKRFSVLEQRFHLRTEGHDTREQYPSFTTSEALYSKVHSWAQKGMIAATDMDVQDTQRYQQLSALLGSEHSVSRIFVSNIPYFFNLSDEKGGKVRKVNFYGGLVKEGDYERIFENLSLVAADKVPVVFASSCHQNSTFPLEEKKLGELLPAAPVRGQG